MDKNIKREFFEKRQAIGVDGNPTEILVSMGRFSITDLERQKIMLDGQKARLEIQLENITNMLSQFTVEDADNIIN